MEDKKISDISKLLIGGAKMLSYHCPDCKVPLFEENKRIFCPSCDREAIIEGHNNSQEGKVEKSATEVSEKSEYENSILDKSKIEFNDENTVPTNADELESIYMRSILRLSKKLENSEDLNEIKEILDIIDRLVKINDKFKRIV